MKFRSKDRIRLRAQASLNATTLGFIEKDTVLESDEYTWKMVTLPDGRKGYCAAEYLEKIDNTPTPPSTTRKWFAPIRIDKFKITQPFLNPDATSYPKTGHHPGVDYGTQSELNVPIYFCADGEVIENGFSNSFGNYFFYYVAEVDRTFLYFHLKDIAPSKGTYKAGTQCGIAGMTGFSTGIHLHLECMRGKKTSTDRANLYTSKSALMAASEDPDSFIRQRLSL